MTHWRTAKPSPHIAACDLDGKDVDVIITSVTIQEVEGEAGRKDNCNVATLSIGGKPCKKTMVLNATNCKAIAKLTGSHQIESWVNVAITLYPTTTKLKREVVECIRIRLNKEHN
jgi:hypothetical protein